jgi:hypothetical protein
MKLQKFNEYLNLPIAGLYHEIDRATQISTGKYESFNRNEINLIKNALPQYEYTNRREDGIESPIGVIWLLDKRAGIESGRFPEVIVVRKIKDGWFEISQESSFCSKIYRCDQIDGLLECIKNNFNQPPMISSLKRGDTVTIKNENDIKLLRIPSYQNLSDEDKMGISEFFGKTAKIVNYIYRLNSGISKIGSDNYFDYILDIDNGDYWWNEDYFE